MTSLTAAVLKSGKSDLSHHRTGSRPAAIYSGLDGINMTLTDVWNRTFLFSSFSIFGSLILTEAPLVSVHSWLRILLFCGDSM